MANVNISFNGKEFLLSCDDGQEEHLLELAEQLNNKFSTLKKPTRLQNLSGFFFEVFLIFQSKILKGLVVQLDRTLVS